MEDVRNGDRNLGSQVRPIKLTVVGDGAVGKTCLLIAYIEKAFPIEYIPTIFDNYSGNMTVDGEVYNMVLWDTAGQEEYDRLRPLSYPDTNCILMCYTVGTRPSMNNIMRKWYPEVKHFLPRVPIVLVATKIDLREDGGETISLSEGRELQHKIKAKALVECSAKTGEGLREVFEQAIRIAVKSGKSKRKFCSLL